MSTPEHAEHEPQVAADLPVLAAVLLEAEREARAADAHRDKLWDELVARMEAEGVPTVDLAEATVTYLEASSSESIDGKACAAKLKALGKKLRELGVRKVDAAVPMKASSRAASLRITPKL